MKENKYEIGPGDKVTVQFFGGDKEYQMINAELIESPKREGEPWVFEGTDGTNKIVAHIYKEMILSKIIS